MPEPELTLSEVLTKAAARCGFLDKSDIATIATHDRLRLVLVRCGGFRFLCAAQYFDDLLRCVVAGGDYVRDVSLPTTDPAMTDAARQKAEVAQRMHEFNTRINASMAAETPAPISGDISHLVSFREEDCGGVFDGHSVTSDADPGL